MNNNLNYLPRFEGCTTEESVQYLKQFQNYNGYFDPNLSRTPTASEETLQHIQLQIARSLEAREFRKVFVSLDFLPIRVWYEILPPTLVLPLGWKRYFTKGGDEVLKVEDNFEKLSLFFGPAWFTFRENGDGSRILLKFEDKIFIRRRASGKFIITMNYQCYSRAGEPLW